MNISIIVVIAQNNAIGINNKLLCHLPADLKYFKEITMGNAVIMGRNTFLSLPKGALPNRRNIVITDNPNDKFNNCTIVSSIDEAIAMMEPDKENFIIGGASIYKQFLPLAQKLYITQIQHNFEADTFFPAIDLNIWHLTQKNSFLPDEKNLYPYSFEVFVRK